VLAGSAVFGLSLLLPYVKVEGESQSFWELATRIDVFLTVLAVAAITLGIVSFFAAGDLLLTVSGALSLVAFGMLIFTLADAQHFQYFRVAAYLAPVGALIASVGGMLPVLADRAPIAISPQRAVTGSGFPPPGTGPPPGWYSDPSGKARQRYWSGSEWTNQLQE
jgi:hypothetical protein